MRVYLTGPISNGFYSQDSDWRIVMALHLNDHGIDCVWGQRMRDYESFRDSMAAAFFEKKFEPARHVMLADYQKLYDSDVVLANFADSPHQPALGACLELGRADALGIKVVAVIPPESVHDHIAVLEACDYVFLTVDDAIDEIVKMSKTMI